VIDAAPATDYDVTGGQGVIIMSAVNSERRAVLDLGYTNQDVQVWNQVPVVPSGAPINWGILLRHVDANNYYWVDVQIGTDSSLTLRLVKRVLGALTQVATVATGVTHDTGVERVLVAQIAGQRIRARLYSSDDPDPGEWQLDKTDDSLTSGTSVGVIGRLMTGNLNVGNTIRFDNFRASAPNPHAWPDGATDFVVECVSHQVAADRRTVTWALAPIVGENVGTAGPWFYSDSSSTSGTDAVPF
jgi:hypothetical protein